MRWTKHLERLLIAFGGLMVCTYVLARIHGLVLSRAEIEGFKSLRLVAQELKGATPAGTTPDFSRWSRKAHSR